MLPPHSLEWEYVKDRENILVIILSAAYAGKRSGRRLRMIENWRRVVFSFWTFENYTRIFPCVFRESIVFRVQKMHVLYPKCHLYKVFCMVKDCIICTFLSFFSVPVNALYVYYANTKGNAKKFTRMKMSLRELSLNINTGIINPMSFKNLGQIIPGRCVPSMDTIFRGPLDRGSNITSPKIWIPAENVMQLHICDNKACAISVPSVCVC